MYVKKKSILVLTLLLIIAIVLEINPFSILLLS